MYQDWAIFLQCPHLNNNKSNKIFILNLNEIYYHGAKNLTKWKSLDINFSNSDSVTDWTSKAMFSDTLLSSIFNIKLKLFFKIKGFNYS